MQEIMAMVIVATIAFAIYKLFELFARRKERITMIEKLSEGISPTMLNNDQRFPFKIPVSIETINGSWAIRIGLLLVGIGLGVVIAAFIDLNYSPYSGSRELYFEYNKTINALYPALAALFGGIGLVIAYLIERKDDKKELTKNEEK